MKNFSKILVLAPKCSPFIVGPLNKLSNYVDEINVLISHNYLSEISRLPIGGYFSHVKKFTKSNLGGSWENRPNNINIHISSMLYFIPDSHNKSLGNKIFKNFKNYIDRNEIKFDLIDSHFIWPCGYAGAKLKEEYNVPLLISARGYDIYDLPFKNNEWKANVEYALNSADHIITVSLSNLESIKKLKVNTPVKVRSNGFDSDLFYPRNQIECRKYLNLPIDKKIILNIGNLTPIKGQKNLIKAMYEILKIRKDVICIIIGSGALKSKIMKLIHSRKLENHVILLDEKIHKEIPLWMNAADVFVLSSLNEGNPNVMFESLATGLPFIGTKVGGVPQVIISEDYGLLVQPDNIQELAEKILIALKKDWDKKKMVEYSMQFTWDNIAKDILTVFKKLDYSTY